jgi:hypothetical protein
VEILEVPKRLYGDHCAGHGIFIGDSFFQIKAYHLPGALAQACQKASIQHEIDPQPFWDAEYPLTVGYTFENVFAQPLAEFDHTFLMRGWAEMPAKSQFSTTAPNIFADHFQNS